MAGLRGFDIDAERAFENTIAFVNFCRFGLRDAHGGLIIEKMCVNLQKAVSTPLCAQINDQRREPHQLLLAKC